MLISNIAYRTFFILIGDYGTGFIVDVDGQEYLITAKHLLGTPDSDLKIYINQRWTSYKYVVADFGANGADIVALRLENPIVPSNLPVKVSGETYIGQDVCFLGFPYKLWMEHGAVTHGRPMPFLKKGVISAFDNDPSILHLDAINNPGFSGGPVYYLDDEKNVVIIGVVADYRIEREVVEAGDLKIEVPYNTGLMRAYRMQNFLSIKF